MSRADFVTDKMISDAINERLGASLLKAHFDWQGAADQVAWQVSYWGADYMCDEQGVPHGMWNFYLLIPEHAFADDTFNTKLWLPVLRQQKMGGAERPVYDEYDAAFSDLPWHCGLTHYSKSGGVDGEPRGVKIGCDYGHAYDRDIGYPFTFESVKADAERCAKAFRELFPTMLWKCAWDGTWHPRDQMVPNKHGALVAAKNRETIPAGWNWFPEAVSA